MRWTFVVFGVLAIVVIAVGCTLPVHQAAAPAESAVVPSGNVEIGNATYIPINRFDNLERSIEVVFAAIAKWESEHPNREVVDIEYVHQQAAYATVAYTYGIIIYSRPKEAR